MLISIYISVKTQYKAHIHIKIWKQDHTSVAQAIYYN